LAKANADAATSKADKAQVYGYMYVYVCMYIFVCNINACIYAYIHTHTHTYSHSLTHSLSLSLTHTHRAQRTRCCRGWETHVRGWPGCQRSWGRPRTTRHQRRRPLPFGKRRRSQRPSAREHQSRASRQVPHVSSSSYDTHEQGEQAQCLNSTAQ